MSGTTSERGDWPIVIMPTMMGFTFLDLSSANYS